MAQSFRGGVRPEGRKIPPNRPIQILAAPSVLRLPLALPVGAEAVPCVKSGDRVLRGQCVAQAAPGLSLPVHSPVSGVVRAVEKGADGRTYVVVENDGKDELSPSVTPWQSLISRAQPEEIIAFLKEKGVAGMGGAAFPVWAKAEGARGKARVLLVNCVESEPYLSSLHRLLLEQTAEVVGGVKILLRATGAAHAVFVVSDDREDAAERVMTEVADSPAFTVSVVKNKYPQGDERLLMKTVLGREVPRGKTLPDAGAVCFNAETCRAVYRAFVNGLPHMERLVTVGGDDTDGGAVLQVPFGTPFEAIFAHCGIPVDSSARLLSGGPMMGRVLPSLQTPLSREHTAALALTAPATFDENGVCVRCGRCVAVCPMRLMPLHFFRLVKAGKAAATEGYFVTDCSECGACAYVCPARLPLTAAAREGKAAVKAARRSGEEAAV